MTPPEMAQEPSSSGRSSARSSAKTWAITVILLLLVVGGVSAAVYKMKTSGTSPAPTDLSLENHLPSNSAFVVAIDTEEENAKKYLPGLMAKFSSAAAAQQWQSSVETALQDDAESVAAPEIAALLRSVRKAVVAVTDETPTTTYAIAILESPAAFTTLSTKLSSVPGYREGSYKSSRTLLNPEKKVFLAGNGETLYAANSEISLNKLVDDTFISAPLSGNENYRTASARSGKSFIHAYFRSEFFGLMTKQVVAREGMTEEEKRQLDRTADALKAISAMTVGVGAEEQGFRLSGLTIGNKTVLDQMQYKFNALPEHEPYLIGSIPAGNTIFVAESYNLRQVLTDSMKLNGMDRKQTEEITSQLRSTLQSVGLDLSNDVYALFEKGTALALQTDTSNLFPRITLVTDISGKEENAKKAVAALDQGLTNLIAQLTAPESGVPPGLVSKTTAKVGSEDFVKVNVNTAAIGAFMGTDASPAMKSAVDGLRVELWMGITDENQLVLTTSSGYDGRYEKDVVSGETEYKDAIGRLSDLGRGIAYVNVANLVSYVDRIYQIAIEAGGTTDGSAYKKFIDTLRPVRYVVAGSSAAEYETTSNGFLKIGE